MSDYGDPAQEADFRCLRAYSPLHNVRPPPAGTRQYPAFLITTGDHDDRVVPLHSHKLTATLQHVLAGGRPLRASGKPRPPDGPPRTAPRPRACSPCTARMQTCPRPAAAPAGTPDSPQRNPLLTRVEVRAGHGAGKPTSKVIQETADAMAFAAACIGARWAHSAHSTAAPASGPE
jgi:prolyl oligopeptidase